MFESPKSHRLYEKVNYDSLRNHYLLLFKVPMGKSSFHFPQIRSEVKSFLQHLIDMYSVKNDFISVEFIITLWKKSWNCDFFFLLFCAWFIDLFFWDYCLVNWIEKKNYNLLIPWREIIIFISVVINTNIKVLYIQLKWLHREHVHMQSLRESGQSDITCIWGLAKGHLGSGLKVSQHFSFHLSTWMSFWSACNWVNLESFSELKLQFSGD